MPIFTWRKGPLGGRAKLMKIEEANSLYTYNSGGKGMSPWWLFGRIRPEEHVEVNVESQVDIPKYQAWYLGVAAFLVMASWEFFDWALAWSGAEIFGIRVVLLIPIVLSAVYWLIMLMVMAHHQRDETTEFLTNAFFFFITPITLCSGLAYITALPLLRRWRPCPSAGHLLRCLIGRVVITTINFLNTLYIVAGMLAMLLIWSFEGLLRIDLLWYQRIPVLLGANLLVSSLLGAVPLSWYFLHELGNPYWNAGPLIQVLDKFVTLAYSPPDPELMEARNALPEPLAAHEITASDIQGLLAQLEAAELDEDDIALLERGGE